MKVIRKQLSVEEVIGKTSRWDDTCLCFQSFNPASGAWYDNPTIDPRTSVIYLLPLRTTGDIKCDSAANMRAAMEEILNQFYVYVEIAQLINAIIGVIGVFQPGYGLLIALLAALIAAIIEIGVASVLFAFSDPTVWDNIQCFLWNSMSADGSITEAQIAEVQTEIETEYPGSVIGLVTSLMFGFLGTTGLTNAGATGNETGDCSDCPQDWRYKWDFHLNDGGFVFDPEAGNTAGVWRGDATHGYGKLYSGIVCAQWDVSRKSTTFSIGATTHILEMTVTLDAQSADQCSHVECYIGTSRANGLGQSLLIYQSTNGTSITDFGDISNLADAHLTFQSGNSSGEGDFYTIELAGTGVPPNFTGGQFI